MFERVRKMLAKYTDTSDIELQSMLEADLGLTSFDVVEIITEFEEEFGIEISDWDIERFILVKDIVDYLENNT